MAFERVGERLHPDVPITRYSSRCLLIGGGGTYENGYGAAVRFKGKMIIRYQEYLNPLKLKSKP